VTDPASPPAIKANPTKRIIRAFQAIPFPEYEYESADNRDLSMEFILYVNMWTEIGEREGTLAFQGYYK
jgi:hypothetical protein